MWNKIEKSITLCIAVLLVVIATVSGTLAYESYVAIEWENTQDKTVKVQLLQQQRVFDEFGNAIGLEPLTNHNVLVPLTASAQYDGSNFDRYGMPTAEGYVDHIIQVKNEGTVHAYVRVIAAIPAALDDTGDAGKNALHWNLGNRFMPAGDFSADNSHNAAFDDISWKYSETAVVNDVMCNLYIFTYQKPLAGGETTEAAAFTGFYLDESVNVADGHILLDGVDTGFTDDGVVIHVEAQAMQTYGFANAEEAFDAAKLPDNPWLGDDQ